MASHKLKMLAKGIYGLQRDDLDDHGRSPIRVKCDDIRGSRNFVSEMQGDMTDIVDQHETILTWTPAGMVAVD